MATHLQECNNGAHCLVVSATVQNAINHRASTFSEKLWQVADCYRLILKVQRTPDFTVCLITHSLLTVSDDLQK